MHHPIIINASAAKLGGAKTIVDSFIAWIKVNDGDTPFILLCPQKPSDLPDNVTYIAKYTGGLGTWLFSCFWIAWICLRHRARACISFNNVNLVLPLCTRITYFHQAKAFTENSLRFRLIRWAIRRLKRSRIIVQSPLIAEQFQQCFGTGYQLDVKWPGIQPPEAAERQRQRQKHRQLLWPVTDPTVRQKNLAWFEQHQQWFINNDIEVLVTSDIPLTLPFFKPIGLQSRDTLFRRYREVDGVLIVSSEETLCLPIFEAASVGANVYVLDMPYIRAIESWRGLPDNVTVINGPEQIDFSVSHPNPINLSYYQPDWQIY
ncbi:hypothetical protein [Aestuariibacter salexigens]|uniref:hypothetical protein n=1 Tax=Aestuariibacter salexigens TaxID=226010 RepID=UPI0003F534D2|nr:hypothetical protein [Aestuariibacter salexigens]